MGLKNKDMTDRQTEGREREGGNSEDNNCNSEPSSVAMEQSTV